MWTTKTGRLSSTQRIYHRIKIEIILTIPFYDGSIFISLNLHLQHKVRELFTEKSKIEEWKFLPLGETSWINKDALDSRMHIDKNFLAINFQLGGILIVNLSSRKKFQIEYDVLVNQIKLVPIRCSDYLIIKSNFSKNET